MKEIVVTIGILDTHKIKFQLIKSDDFKTEPDIMSNDDKLSLKVDIFNIMRNTTDYKNMIHQEVSISKITILEIDILKQNLFSDKIVVTV